MVLLTESYIYFNELKYFISAKAEKYCGGRVGMSVGSVAILGNGKLVNRVIAQTMSDYYKWVAVEGME